MFNPIWGGGGNIELTNIQFLYWPNMQSGHIYSFQSSHDFNPKNPKTYDAGIQCWSERRCADGV